MVVDVSQIHAMIDFIAVQFFNLKKIILGNIYSLTREDTNIMACKDAFPCKWTTYATSEYNSNMFSWDPLKTSHTMLNYIAITI